MRPRTVLALSSWVGVGAVGLSAAQPIWTRLGVRSHQAPTVMLSNHRGWPAVAGAETPAPLLLEMVDAVAANGWLTEIDAALIGYLPSRAHVDAAGRIIARIRAARPEARILLDPVLGDWPKGFYVPEALAAAIRDQLAPLADILTPNLFELAALTGAPLRAPLPDLDAARAALAALRARAGVAEILLTSPPLGPGRTGLLSLSDAGASLYETEAFDGPMPKGAGDAFAALIAAGDPAGRALGRLTALLNASRGAAHLRLDAPEIPWPDAAEIASRAL